MPIALASNALLTEAELEVMLQTTLDSDLANMLINIASQQIESICNRSFIKTSQTLEKYSIDSETKYLFLKKYPIASAPALAVKEYDSMTDSLLYAFTVNQDYELFLDEGYIYFYGSLPRGKNHIRVTYDAGYVIASVPYDLKSACAQLAGLYYTTKLKAGVSAERIGNYSINYDKTVVGGSEGIGLPVPPEVYSICMKYRRDTI
jgi:hypothetical protein